MAKKKEKKEKIRYYDDGRTLSDMSGVNGSPLSGGDPYRPRASFKAKWDTYWNAVRMMFVPMLFVLVILSIAYMVLYLLFSLT